MQLFQHNVESRRDTEHIFLVVDLGGEVPSVFPLRKMLLRKYSAVLIFLNGSVEMHIEFCYFSASLEIITFTL